MVRRLVALATMFNAVAVAAYATPIAGTLAATGGITISATDITFTQALTSGLFAGLAGSGASEQPLTFSGGPVSNFVSFTASPGLALDVTGVNAGIFSAGGCTAAPAAAGQTCTPPSSPLSFVNTSSGSMVTLSLRADVSNSATGVVTPGTLTYSIPFEGLSYQQVLSTIGGGGTIASSYSAQFGSAAGSVGFQGSVNLTAGGLTFQSGGAPNETSIGWAPFAGPDFLEQLGTGSFAPFIGDLGDEQTLPFAAGPMSFLDLPAFSQLAGDFVNFDSSLFGFTECAAPPAAGQTCSPPLSPLNAMNVTGNDGSLNAVLFFDLDLNVVNTATGDVSPYGALYTTQFANMSYQQLFATLATNGGAVNGVYSLSLAPEAPPVGAVPEPASLLLVGSGLLGAGIWRRTRQLRDSRG